MRWRKKNPQSHRLSEYVQLKATLHSRAAPDLFNLQTYCNEPLKTTKPFELSVPTSIANLIIHWFCNSINREILIPLNQYKPWFFITCHSLTYTLHCEISSKMENADNFPCQSSPRTTLTPPKSHLLASYIMLQALYNSQRLLVLCYKDEIRTLLDRLVNKEMNVVRTMMLTVSVFFFN